MMRLQLYAGLAVFLAGAPLLAQPATTQAAPNASLQQWVAQLADPDAAVREEARGNLLGIKRSELPLLREIVRKTQPLLPAQTTALYDIVVHVYLAEEPYQGTAAGFLGIRMTAQAMTASQNQNPPAPPAPSDASDAQGVVIIERVPGFCGYRLLQNGDVLLGLAQQSDKPFSTPMDVQTVVSNMKAGELLQLEVLRQGRKISMLMKLESRPAGTEGESFQIFQNRRQQKAQEYWEENFGAVISAMSGE